MMSPPPEPPALQTPNSLRRQIMANSPIVVAPGPGNSPATILHMSNGVHAISTPQHTMMTPPNAMQINGHGQGSFLARR
jgi:hypothetical protein